MRLHKLQEMFRIKTIRYRFLASMLLLVLISIPTMGYTTYRISTGIIEKNHEMSYRSNLETSNTIINNTINTIIQRAQNPFI